MNRVFICVICTSATLLLLSGCMSPGGTGGAGGSTGSPLPTPSSGGGTGTPSPSGLPAPLPTPSQSETDPAGGTQGESGQSGNSDQDGTGEQDAPEWDNASQSPEGESDEVTFEEETQEDAAPDPEQPTFEEQDGLTEEELAELEQELDETLSDFDEEIEREQTYAQERANENQDALGNIGEFEEYDEERVGSTNARSSGQAGSKSGEASEGAGQSNGASDGGAGGASAKGGTPRQGGNPPNAAAEGERDEDQPDVRDLRKNDDIVARQIREAAEKETDPVLKKKLWEEYYNYKKN